MQFDMLNKENNVKGGKAAKPAPDFSKLHKQWDTKLRQGKAISKKPLTTVQPFSLTKKRSSQHSSASGSSSSSLGEDFEVDDAAKESILNCEGIKEESKPHRATTALTGRTSFKSLIPRPPFNASRGGSLYTKPTQPKEHPLDTSSNARVVVSRPISIASSPSIKSAHELEGFNVDFQVDKDALNSILNCEGISLNDKTPSKLSSQYGPAEKPKRVKGRIVSSSYIPTKTSRFSMQPRSVSHANNVLSSKKQRWSIYSRDNGSTQTDLKTWLKELMDKTGSTGTTAVSTASTSYGKQNTNLSPPTNAGGDDMKFSKTVVGYQGVCAENVSTGKSDITNFTSSYFATPDQKRLNHLKESTVKSILKNKDLVNVKLNELKTPLKPLYSERSSKNTTKTPQKTNTLLPDRTPIRFSTYARQQRLLGLPLPKENRYERLGERITSPPKSVSEKDSRKEYCRSPCIPPGSLSMHDKITESVSVAKRVRFAELDRESLGQIEEKKNLCVDFESTNISNLNFEEWTIENIGVTDSTEKEINTHLSAPFVSLTNHLNTVNQENKSVTNAQGLYTSTTNATHKPDSWATILSREIADEKGDDLVKTHSDGCFLDFSLKQPSPKHEGGNHASDKTKKKKSKSNNRNSILERIYGDAITFIADDDSPIISTKSNINMSSNISILPVPALDEKDVARIMSDTMIQDDDEDYMPSPFMSSFRQTTENGSTNSFQSTIINTPASKTDLPSFILKDDETPSPTNLQPLNSTLRIKIPEAPSKRATAKARTPYKQAMLDYLEKAMATWAKNKDAQKLECDDHVDEPVIENIDDNIIPTSNSLTSTFGKNLAVTLALSNTSGSSHPIQNHSVDAICNESVVENSNYVIDPRENSSQNQKIGFVGTSENDSSLYTDNLIVDSTARHVSNKLQCVGIDSSIVNILSPSMRKFTTHSFTTYSQLCEKPLFAVTNVPLESRTSSTTEDKNRVQKLNFQNSNSLLKSLFNQTSSVAGSTKESVLKPALFTPSFPSNTSSSNAITSEVTRQSVLKPASFKLKVVSEVPLHGNEDLSGKSFVNDDSDSSARHSFKPMSLSLRNAETINASNTLKSAATDKKVTLPLSNTSVSSHPIQTHSVEAICNESVVENTNHVIDPRENSSQNQKIRFVGTSGNESSLYTNDLIVDSNARRSIYTVTRQSVLKPASLNLGRAETISALNTLKSAATDQEVTKNFFPSNLFYNGFDINPKIGNGPLTFTTKTPSNQEAVSQPQTFVPTMCGSYHSNILSTKSFCHVANSPQNDIAASKPANDIFTTSTSSDDGVFKSAISISPSNTRTECSLGILKPSKLVESLSGRDSTTDEPSEINAKSYSLAGETLWNESSFSLDDTDICIVISKSEETITKTSMHQPFSKARPFGVNSAFRHVPATCNIAPRLPIYNTQSSADKSNEMKQLKIMQEHLLQSVSVCESVLNAEISLYSKFGEISIMYVKHLKNVEKRDGATCPLNKLLNYGDDQHFIPI